MANLPWITIIGLGEDGPEGLPPASRDALAAAEIIMGPARHLALIGPTNAQQVEWPVPFADGIDVLRGHGGRPVAVLVSGDPFWYGAGRAMSKAFGRDAWRAIPVPSVFSLVSSRMGWPIEDTLCIGLHARPFEQLRAKLAPGRRIIATLRDGPAVSGVAHFLRDTGFGGSTLTVCEAVGGPREVVTQVSVAEALKGGFSHPVTVAVELHGTGEVIPLASGRPDALFQTDGVMTKRPVRALTLSALAPRAGEHLWDIGGGSGSIAVEWALADRTCTATVVETRADRVALIRANVESFGLTDQVTVLEGMAPGAMADAPPANAVFIGGGLSPEMLQFVTALPKGTRVVANAVTLEAEAHLAQAQGSFGGDLMRIEIAHAQPLGPKRGWTSAYPVVQWSVTL
ncbi:bifunctional cobalt-precorrin-7 (C(5))-methyltransferase/cobalt-precorrin-6B (C(15))-methyltransferase [Jannaschia sp. CCS1]|uniref:bifunctional cobalt-precorrin-7 (C(5))-methyltransferase/cobalt-precorrin-6B (C(15))-methyltransferase n=1 Tax=Jannaschia sp. (strain CCS1) TaxID=290400 RepID=UPI000053A133|nr:bifunctional cobalt-precorrin-7 (C(5))-methyltransferase/cobalt-precorrin-6B (C(15))-methyltransferase [Jannaschia sp. CCS1]ABD55842.1 precorrin-6Y C5,15-methyltransferase (decarboxylating) [Jannaschia sp. CCS1]